MGVRRRVYRGPLTVNREHGKYGGDREACLEGGLQQAGVTGPGRPPDAPQAAGRPKMRLQAQRVSGGKLETGKLVQIPTVSDGVRCHGRTCDSNKRTDGEHGRSCWGRL